MPLNIPGVLVPLHLLVNPRLVVPSLIVKDIRQLDFPELRRAGYRGAVFDKDNCLTRPHHDTLVPELRDAWEECKETFGRENVLIVSNSAGSHLDAGGIEAESVSYHLSAPVLRHTSLKPAYACIKSIRAYFASLPRPVRDEELIIVGDRLLTDVVMANRMARRRPLLASPDSLGNKAASAELAEPEKTQNTSELPPPERIGPLAVWTERTWVREGTFVRWIETSMLRGVERWVVGLQGLPYHANAERFVRPLPKVEMPVKQESLLRRLWSRFRT